MNVSGLIFQLQKNQLCFILVWYDEFEHFVGCYFFKNNISLKNL